MKRRAVVVAVATLALAVSAASCKKKSRQSAEGAASEPIGNGVGPSPSPVGNRGAASYELDITGAHRVHGAGSGATVRTLAGSEYINLTSDDGTVNLTVSGKGPIEVGAIELGADSQSGWSASIELPREANRPTFVATKGTIDISRVEASAVAGSFDLAAVSKKEPTAEIQASGRFTARRSGP